MLKLKTEISAKYGSKYTHLNLISLFIKQEHICDIISKFVERLNYILIVAKWIHHYFFFLYTLFPGVLHCRVGYRLLLSCPLNLFIFCRPFLNLSYIPFILKILNAIKCYRNTNYTLKEESFAGRNFRGSRKPRNIYISREYTFADDVLWKISLE